jgi:glucose-1-phosphate adenylyltransferase
MAQLELKPFTSTNVLAVIMGGGAGTRLFPLTKERSKPAVPIAGKYRLVDFPISNCLNSNFRQMYVLTQFNSHSLHRHIHQSYRFDRFSLGFVEILAAQQTPSSCEWYQGTADAVRQNLRYILQGEYDYILILSGDQLYRMDYRRLLRQHVDSCADITIGVIPIKREEASAFGILQVDDEKRIVGFVEKPKDPRVLDGLQLTDPLLSNVGITSGEDHLLASMGIYVFNREVLRKALDNEFTDFGRHIIPEAINRYRVYAYIFRGYWEDVGTIKSFFDAHMGLCGAKASFNFFDRDAPIYTHARYLPASRVMDSRVRNALVADGCIIVKSNIENSVIGLRSFISSDCELRDTISMGCDFYETQHQALMDDATGIPHMSIGRGCRIQRAIIDKNAHIGDEVVVTDKTGAADFDGPNYYVRDGIVIIPKNAVIPAGTRI